MESEAFRFSLSPDEVWMLAEGLDAYEYWQLGDLLPRNNGDVFVPGDLTPGADRYWDDVEISSDQREAIEQVHACRALRERLLRALPAPTADP